MPTATHQLKTPERRRHPRMGFDSCLYWNNGGADRSGWTEDLSDSGIGFTTRALSAPKPGEKIQVSIELDDGLEWLVDKQATVVRCDPRGQGLYSVGLELSQPFPD